MKRKTTVFVGASRVEPARNKALLVLAGCGAALLSALPFDDARATPGSGVVGEPIALGRLPEPILATLEAASEKDPHGHRRHGIERRGFDHHRDKHKGDAGESDDASVVEQIVLMKFTIQPGGYFGWHQHGGPVWVAVASGTLTLYEGDDATCTGDAYKQGSAFLDAGDHTHNARNEGDTPVVVYGTFLLPLGGAVRIDAPNPNVCAF